MHKSVEKEIYGLHAFFEAWYRGTAENTDAVFGRVADVLGFSQN